MSEPLRQMTLWPDVGGSTSSLGACPASRRVSRASDRVPRIPGGSGRNTSGWSWISNLSGYLRRTCQVFSRSGNPAPCSLIWKRRVMKCGRSSWVLGRSVPRTSGIGCGLSADEWGTPNSHERTHAPRMVDHGIQLANQVALWTTPCVRDAESLAKVTRGAGSLADGQQRVQPLAVQAAQWPTPRTEDSEQAGSHRGTPDTLTSAARLFPTPAVRDYRSPNAKSYQDRGGASKGEQLPNFLAHCCAGPPAPASPNMSGSSRDWSTPNVPNGGRKPKGGMNETGMTPDGKKRQVGLQNQLGASAGQLNPAWVAQLQGLPDDWLDLPDAVLSRLLATRTRRLSRT